MKTKHSTVLKRAIAGLLVAITVVGVLTPTTNVYAASKYTTHSPLLSGDTMAIDEIDPYELICYGIFLSNFCVPFVDSYPTAFSQTATTGSKGAGIHALKFATGGDINADSIVNRMTNYVMGTLASQYQELTVVDKGLQNNIWQSKSTLIEDSTESTNARPAMLADLLPLIGGIVKSDDTSIQFDYNNKTGDVWSHAWLAGITSDSSYVENDDNTGFSASISDFTITAGVLGEFYISDGSTGEPTHKVFDMTNGWDVQIPSQCLLYAAYKDGGQYLNEVMQLIDSAHNIPLVMDSIGNICALKSTTELIIIIPAYLNQHLTDPNFINLTGSAVLNTIASSTEKLDLASSVSGVRAVNSSAIVNANSESLLLATIDSAGLGSVIHSGATLSPGTSILYNNLTDYKTDTITNADFRKFVDTGLDTQNKLRWSTLVYHKADTSGGLDLQNTIDVGKRNMTDEMFIVNNGVMLQLNNTNSYVFSYSTQWSTASACYGSITPEVGTSIDNKSTIYELLSLFQTAAQCYASTVNTDSIPIKAYYCDLKTGNKAADRVQLFHGIDTIDSTQSDKSELLYVPIGADYSYIENKINFWDYVDSITPEILTKGSNSFADILQINKALAAICVDMYHNNTHTLPTEIARTLGNEFVNKFVPTPEITVSINNYITSITHPVATWNPYTIINNCNVSGKTIARSGRQKAVIEVLTDDIIGVDVDSTADDDLINIISRVHEYHADYTPSFLNYLLTSNWAKIAVATPTLSTASSYLGLCDDYMFSTFASNMYYTYLDMYGFIAGDHLFNESIYLALQSDVCGMSAEQMGEKIMTQGLTAEQKQQVLKDNAYLMLSTNADGREYRSRMVSGMIEEWLIDNYDKTCYGDTESKYFQTLTSTSKSFVNLPTYAENWLTEWIVSRWDVVLPFIMLFLFIIVAAFGTLNGKKVSWILANLLLTACMLVVLPGAAEIAPYLVEKVSDSAFKDVIGTMAISEAVEDDTIQADIERQYGGYSEDIIAAVKSISGLGTSGSLLLKQDMTRKVVPASVSTSYDQLKGLATAQWLIPSLLSMTGADDVESLDDYVYRTVGEKRIELRNMKKSSSDALPEDLITLINSVIDNEINETQFKLSASNAHLIDVFLYQVNGAELNSYNFENTTAAITDELRTYDGEEKLNSVNYLQGTETILPYFYLVAYDSLINATGKTDFNAVTPADFFNSMQHSDAENDGTYSNKLTIIDDSVKDFLDLEFLFEVYVPYLHAMQEQSKSARSGYTLGPAYTLYFDEPESFLYECNWSDKILNAYDFGDDAKPSTYIDRYGRDMIFSRAQLAASGLSVDDLTEVELRCIEINDEVDKQWTLLINYVGTDGVTTDILVEQMALTATVAFNSIMSKDRVVNSNYALYPSAVSIRTINFDTMLKLVLMSNFGLADTNQNSMRIVLAESGLLVGFALWFLALLVTHVVPFVTGLSMAVVFYASILSCVYNAAVDGKEKLKTCGGAAVTCLAIGIETCAYVYSYALIIGNTHKVLSVDKIQAGTTVATGKVFAILIITIIYLALLLFQAWKNAMNFRDMGAQMWASYSKKTFDAVTNFAKGFASKLKGAVNPDSFKQKLIRDAIGNVEVKTKIEDDVKVRNDSKNPLFVKNSNSADEATYLWYDDNESDHSGYQLNTSPKDLGSTTSDKKPDATTKKSDATSDKSDDKKNQ